MEEQYFSIIIISVFYVTVLLSSENALTIRLTTVPPLKKRLMLKEQICTLSTK